MDFTCILRFKALTAVTKTFRPSVPLSFLVSMLGFNIPPSIPPDLPPLPGCSAASLPGVCAGVADTQQATEACYEWAVAHGVLFVKPEGE